MEAAEGGWERGGGIVGTGSGVGMETEGILRSVWVEGG